MSDRGPALRRGDLLPKLRTKLPGPKARAFSRRVAKHETPGLAPPGGDQAFVWAEARGSNVLDLDGNRFIDFTSGFGVAAVGHRHPRVVSALRKQSGLLVHGLADAQSHPSRGDLARELAQLSPMKPARVAYAVSGSDAVELAIKTALVSTGKSRLLCFNPAYHGLTLGSLAATSRDRFRSPFRAHLHDHVSRLPFSAELSEVDRLLQTGDFAAILVEPVVAREGVLLPQEGWLKGLQGLAEAHGALLVADEIFTGFGRTGSWFASQQHGVEPDLVCCGKAVAGGFPFAAVLGRSKIMERWDCDGEAQHTATFAGNPLACAAALASLQVLRGERLIARGKRLGALFSAFFSTWLDATPAVESIQGVGALWGLKFGSAGEACRFERHCLQHGILVLVGGAEGRTAQLTPPLVITDRQLSFAFEVLESF